MMKAFLAALAVLAIAIAAPVALAGNGAHVTNSCPSVGTNPFTGLPGCNFSFFDGNGNPAVYAPTSFQDVVKPSGNETEVFKGTIANDTGQAVIYTTNSGGPIPANQTCFSFVSSVWPTAVTTPNWQETISASGNFTLTCHFGS
jgi:hypothetical protein